MNTFKKKQISLTFDNIDLVKDLFGEQDANLKVVVDILGIDIHSRGNTINISGDVANTELSCNIFKQLYDVLKSGCPIYVDDVKSAVRVMSENKNALLRDFFLDTACITLKKKFIKPKSNIQKKYIDAIRKSDIVFGIGPAGTGKTYLAVAMAVSALSKSQVSRIVLTRPAVEAGETLGFLPGDLYDKINPYLRPLYDALHDMMPMEKVSKLIDNGIIEIAPIAFMRGRTLSDSFIILDEAQNTTTAQMKMFLTRIGPNSKAVITGDITQIDLPPSKKSGLKVACDILISIQGLRFIFFSKLDVVRHRLVQDIINAYELAEDTR